LTSSTVKTDEKQILLALINSRKEMPEEAIAVLRQALKFHNDSRLWNALAQKLSLVSDYTGAKKAFARAELSGQNPGVFENNLAMLASTEGDIDRALIYIKRSVVKAPENKKFDNNYRILHLIKGDYISALKDIPINIADTLLLDAAIIARARSEYRLADLFVKKAQAISPVYRPELQEMIEAFRLSKTPSS